MAKTIQAYNLKNKRHDILKISSVEKSPKNGRWFARGEFSDGTKGAVFIKDSDVHLYK